MDIKKIKQLRDEAKADWNKAGDLADAAAYEGMIEAYDNVLNLVNVPGNDLIEPGEDGIYTKDFEIKIEASNHYLYPCVFTEGPGFKNVEALKNWLKNSYNLLQEIRDALEEEILVVNDEEKRKSFTLDGDDTARKLIMLTDPNLGHIPYALGDLVNFIQIITDLINVDDETKKKIWNDLNG